MEKTISLASILLPDEARSIAKEAYIYGYPLVDNYRVMHTYFVDSANPEFKAPWNTIRSFARVFTPEDKAIQTPNSDTPYSFLGLDLRAEPVVLTVPLIEKGRYFSAQMIDSYTFNFAYIGSRATGNDGGTFLIAGPDWNGNIPEGVKQVIRSETEFVFIVFRTQLFNPADMENVKRIQAGNKVQMLSAYLGKPPVKEKPISFIAPLSPEAQKTSLDFFNILNFALGFCPVHPSETDLMEKFSKLGIGAGRTFDPSALSPELVEAVEAGIAEAWAKLDELIKTQIETGKVTSGDLFGSREYMKNNYLYRFAADILGIYGNCKQEAMYPAYRIDSDGQPMDGSKSRYALRFAPGQLPPVNAFWSLTLYQLPDSLLSANPINRYLINSSMLPLLKQDGKGGVTLYIQHESPGADLEANWLPAPNGPFWMSMRLYWPKEEALTGKWKMPPLVKNN